MNAPPRRSLRPYQARLIADVCRCDSPVLVEQPTGSGKTMQIVTLVAMQLGQRFSHAVIAAPQQQIEHAFVHGTLETNPRKDPLVWFRSPGQWADRLLSSRRCFVDVQWGLVVWRAGCKEVGDGAGPG